MTDAQPATPDTTAPPAAEAAPAPAPKRGRGRKAERAEPAQPIASEPEKPSANKPATGGRMSSLDADLEAWGINTADLLADDEAAPEPDGTSPEIDSPDQLEPPGVDPFDGEDVPMVTPSADDMLDLESAALPGDADPDKPANKGVPPMHELERRGLVPDDVMVHIREYRRGYTHAKQEAAALRKELAALRGEAPQEPALDATPVPFDAEYAGKIRELAATTVDPASIFTAEGAALAAKIEAAKLLIPQIEHAEKLRAKNEAARAQVEAQRQAKKWVSDNPWVMTPGIKEATAEYIKSGMDLEAAAWRAYGEHKMKSETQKENETRAARAAALSKTTGTRTQDTTVGRRKHKSAVEIYQEEMARRGT